MQEKLEKYYMPTHRSDTPENLKLWSQKKGLKFQNLKLTNRIDCRVEQTDLENLIFQRRGVT